MAYPLNNLADLYCEQRRYVEAEPLYQQALSIREHTLEPYHPAIADTLQSFAAFREAQGNIEQAASLYGHALAIYEQVYGTEHSKTTQTRERLYTKLSFLVREDS